jgi:hypothetical protein
VLPDCTSDKSAYLDYVYTLSNSWVAVGKRWKERRRDLTGALREWSVLRRRAETIEENDCTLRARAALIEYFDGESEAMDVFMLRQANLFRLLWNRELSGLVYHGRRVNMLAPWRVPTQQRVLDGWGRASQLRRRLLDTIYEERRRAADEASPTDTT